MDSEKRNKLVAEMRSAEEQRKAGYRERALALFPHVCARCTREFEGKNLKELTVHHRDHNHDNNPPDGKNWELLCIYCHEHEHTRAIQTDRDSHDVVENKESLSHSPFAGLGDRFKEKT